MTRSIVVLGAGYAGAAAVARFERTREDVDLVWISRDAHHFVLHESHRVIGNRDAADALTIPVSDIASPETTFVEGTVTGVERTTETVRLDGVAPVSYDYLVVAIGSTTEFYGIPGVETNAHTLQNRADAVAIADRVSTLGQSSTPADPARVAIGGAGLSGVQIAGEIADHHDQPENPVDIRLLEARDSLLPNEDPELAPYVGKELAARDIDLTTGHPVVAADEDSVAVEDVGSVPYDLFIWTGGVTGRKAVTDGGAVVPERRGQNAPGPSAQQRVFVAGDAAFVGDGSRAPPTAQAAWQAGDGAAENVLRSIRGRPPSPFRYRDRGTLLSVGDAAVAHSIPGLPRRTFGGLAARTLKKAVAARWIASITSPRRAARVWRYL